MFEAKSSGSVSMFREEEISQPGSPMYTSRRMRTLTIPWIPTRAGAGTSFRPSELDRYYVAAPANANEDAAILVYTNPRIKRRCTLRTEPAEKERVTVPFRLMTIRKRNPRIRAAIPKGIKRRYR